MNIDEVLNYTPTTSVQADDSDRNFDRKRKKFDLQISSNNLSSKDIQQLIEHTDNVKEIDEASLKRLISQFERRVLINQELRIKHADNPSKFMDSEFELYDIIKNLHVVCTQPSLYNILIELNITPSLLGLLTHANTDIACAVVALIQELTDLDDVEEINKISSLIEVFIENQIIILLVNNMDRLDENVKEESEGIYNSLAIIENFTDYKPELSKDVKPLIQWLLRKLKSKPIFYTNKLYASEILSILLQNSDENRSIIGIFNGIDILLHVVSYYMRHDPLTADEEEFVENLFNCLCSSLFLSKKNCQLFFQAEGIELMILILKEKRKKVSSTDVRVSALKLLSHCFSIDPHDGLLQSTCDKFVEIFGLRVLMPIYLKPSSIIGQKRKRKQSLIDQVEEHSLSIILALLSFCESDKKNRVLNKFVENNFVKTERLIELHFKYYERLNQCDNKIKVDGYNLNQPEMREMLFLRRFNDGGLFTLQLIDQIMILIGTDQTVIENGNDSRCNNLIKSHIMKLLNMHKTSSSNVDHMNIIRNIVKEYAEEKSELERQRLINLIEIF